MVSHDIKNPLISQKEVLEVLVNNIDNIQTNDLKIHCGNLLNSSRSLLDLLYNLLNWSQIESKSIKFNPIRVDILAIIAETKETLYISLYQKRIDLKVVASQKVLAYGDYNMLSTVIRNILNNAVKYSHLNGAIEISITNYSSEMWNISIKDNGIGMSKQAQESLFKLTSVNSKLGTSGESGSGLGLIITKEMVAMNGGKLEFSSTENLGTTISFTIQKANESN